MSEFKHAVRICHCEQGSQRCCRSPSTTPGTNALTAPFSELSCKSWNCSSCKKSCRHDTNHNVLEKLDVSWYQYDFLLRLAKLFTFPLSLQAILMNLMCVDQRSGESAETVKRIDNGLKATFLNVCWRQELLEEYFTAVSFSLPLEASCGVTVCAHTVCTQRGGTTTFFKKYFNGFD